MKTTITALLLALTLATHTAHATTPPPNTLTPDEIANGWTLLWDGATTEGWRSVKNNNFPPKGWTLKDGVLTVQKKTRTTGGGGDIITAKTYASFELSVDFKMTAGANSGIKYFAQVRKNDAVGPEFQILDDERHSDAKKVNHRIGALYDLISAPDDKPKGTINEWHTARIVARGNHVEHWLDGVKLVEYERTGDAFRALVKKSKFRGIPQYGEAERGHILLQDHQDEVSFRNIKIRELK
ncbi:MAG: DUF1080 domain-containing protein [Puniceicoccales bacterium]|jgi:hypothetical protein|nr:DUF1080 domain-containing protein [Puniceicoccales bacterium]